MSLKERMDARHAGLPPPCVETDIRIETITIHVSNGDAFAFPWSRFAWARVRDDELMLSFADHEIVVRGRNLNGVLEKIAAFQVETLRVIEPHFMELLDHHAPVISEITVRRA